MNDSLFLWKCESIFLVNTSFESLQSIYCYFYKDFKFLREKFFKENGFSTRKRKMTCEKSGAQTSKIYSVRHKKRCIVGTLLCSNCPNFATLSQANLNVHSTKNIVYVYPKHRKLTSLHSVTEFLLAFIRFIRCDYTNRKRTTRKVLSKRKL